MDIKVEIEKLKNLPLETRAKQNIKKEGRICKICFFTFVIIGFLYGVCGPSKEYAGFDHKTFESIYKYPDGSFYNYLSPKTGFLLFLIVGLIITLLLAKTYKKRWNEYNEVIRNAQYELKKNKEAERLENQLKNEALFNVSFDNLVNKYGNPDSQLCVGDVYDIKSYIIPFSQARKIFLLGTEMNFCDIIDVQLTDDKKVIKGQITAVTKSKNGSTVGRAVVGGMLAGGAGAVIGGTTGKKNTTFQQADDIVTHNFTVLVTTKNIANPLVRINLSRDEHLANNITATLKAVIANQ